MNRQRLTVGTQANFFPAGRNFTVPGNGVCSATAKPGAADTGWIYWGGSKWKIANKSEHDDYYAPSPGAYMLQDQILKKKALSFKGTIMELQNLVYQSLLGTLALPDSPAAGGQYNPNAGDPMIRGWLQLQQFTQGNVLFNTVEHYGGFKIPSDVSFEDGPVDIDIEFMGFFSTLNTGTLA